MAAAASPVGRPKHGAISTFAHIYSPILRSMKTTARVRRVGIYIRISDDREGAGHGVKRQL